MKTMTMVMAALVIAAAPCVAQDIEAKRAVQTKLDSLKVTLDYTQQPLEDVIAYLREVSGLNFHIDGDIRNVVPEEQLKISIKVRELSLRSALKLMLGKDLTVTYKEGILIIKQKKAAQVLSTQMYDVRDLMLPIADFPGPKLELATDKSGIIPPQFPDEPEGITQDMITELVKSSTGGKSWDESEASVSLANGMLVVSQSAAHHKEIAQLLNRLRALK